MLLEDKIEPLVREIAHFLDITGAGAGSTWKGYRRDEDLKPWRRKKNDEVDFGRSNNTQARFEINKIRDLEPLPGTYIIHPEIVLEDKQKYGASVLIDNLNSDSESGAKTLSIEFADGETEADAISTSMKNELWATASVEAKVEAGPASAEAKVESGWKNTIELAWNKQTGKSRDTKISFTSEESAPPRTKLEQRLQWNEQTKQRRIQCSAMVDFDFMVGRWSHGDWNTGSPVRWESIEHLIAVAEKRGRVEHARYEHFSRRILRQPRDRSLWRGLSSFGR